MRTNTRTYDWIGAVSLVALTMLIAKPARVHAGKSLPADDHTVVTAPAWLNGRGVAVYYPPTPYYAHPQNDDGTIQYECVELAVRLYATIGYTEPWPISYAYQVAGLAGKQSFPDWVFLANGAKTPPRQGDIIVWPGWYNGGAGHVAIVNLVDGEVVQIIHQNVWRGNKPRPISEMTLRRDRQERFILIGGDGNRPVGWIHSARMESWLHPQPGDPLE